MPSGHERKDSVHDVPAPNLSAGGIRGARHPSGKEGHSKRIQVLRGFLFTAYFLTCIVVIHITQWIGTPLYFINREMYYAYMAYSKKTFALTVILMTQMFGPTTIRISGDASVAGEIRRTDDGMVEFDFPERAILIANHQIYTDWLYLWWVGYCNKPGMHGHLYIILKETLKFIPILGIGMMFYGFIFMSRKMSVDRPRMAYRINKLKMQHVDPTGKSYLDPMWLLLFPEGTNLCDTSRTRSAQWAEKNGLRDTQHILLPRSTGIYFCLKELGSTVEYVYDCTVAYEGIPRGGFGEDYFTLSSTYFEGRPPKSVNFHWRKFRVADIPLEDQDAFEVWLRERWYEKDDLMEQYVSTGRLPPIEGDKKGYIEAEVRTKYPWEIAQAFVVLGALKLGWNVLQKMWASFTSRIVGIFG